MRPTHVQVRAVRLRKDRIAVALEHKVLVYNFADLRLLHAIETLSNPRSIDEWMPYLRRLGKAKRNITSSMSSRILRRRVPTLSARR